MHGRKHTLLAGCCLRVLQSLTSDMCKIGDASVLNQEVIDLPTRISGHIFQPMCGMHVDTGHRICRAASWMIQRWISFAAFTLLPIVELTESHESVGRLGWRDHRNCSQHAKVIAVRYLNFSAKPVNEHILLWSLDAERGAS